MTQSIPFFEHLPDKLVVDILLRVPAMSLQRLRSVCRRWKAIIDKKQFVDDQHERALSGYPSILMFFERPDDAVCVLPNSEAFGAVARKVVENEETAELEAFRRDGGSSHEQTSSRSAFSIWRWPGFSWDFGITWHADQGCNLMCYRTDADLDDVVLILLNPVTGNEVELPPCPYFCHDCYEKNFSYWLGFDFVSGFYKVVVVRVGCFCYGYDKPAGMIYTVGKDRSWRLLKNKVRNRLIQLNSSGLPVYCEPTYYKGRLFWNRTSGKMAAFDFATEKIRVMDTPERGQLFVMGKSSSRNLVFVSCVNDGSTSTNKMATYRIWALHECSESEKPVWTLMDKSDMKIPKTLSDIRFISSLSEDHLLVTFYLTDRDVLREERKKESCETCDSSFLLACYSITDGALSCLDHHLPSILTKEHRLARHFLIHPSLGFP